MADYTLILLALIFPVIYLFVVVAFQRSSTGTGRLSYHPIMVYYMMARGTVPSFAHTPVRIECNRETCPKRRIRRVHKARSYRAMSTTSRKTSGRVPTAGPATQLHYESGVRSTWRKILGTWKCSKIQNLSSRSTKTCDVHSPTPRSSPTELCSEAPTLANVSIRKKEARALLGKTRMLESSLSPSQATCSLESDDNDERPPQYATLDPYPLSGTAPDNCGRSTTCTSGATRKNGLRSMSKKLRKRMFNAIRNISPAAQSAQVK